MIISAVPFTGNKRKLWSKIEPLLPESDVFVDMFTGGGTVALNATKLYGKVYAGEIQPQVIRLHRELQDKDFIKTVTRINDYYPDDKAGYYKLREDYNINRGSGHLLNLILRSNTNYMRFNRQGNFNMPYGERNHYNLCRMTIHQKAAKNVEWLNMDFEDLSNFILNSVTPDKKITFYSDSPYSGTLATYNENGGWTADDDKRLQHLLLTLNTLGHNVVVSNVFENKGNVNKIWVDWCDKHSDKFDVHHLNHSYNNSSFRKSNAKTDEVLIVSK